jgi:hypothetical protein
MGKNGEVICEWKRGQKRTGVVVCPSLFLLLLLIERFFIFTFFLAFLAFFIFVDLHLHTPQLVGHKSMLDSALARLRPAHTFLATEFSTVWHFRQQMDTVSREFCTKYGFPVKMKVHELLSAGIKSPMPLGQWEDFLRGEKWYGAEEFGCVQVDEGSHIRPSFIFSEVKRY